VKYRDVIIRPLVTEHSAKLKEEGKYLFEVHLKANKNEIKKAIESIFIKDKVRVKHVRTAVVPGKIHRLGRNVSKPYRWKKAIITLQAGQKIEIFEGA
jgi:large subunit ribosomal protein L23